MKGIIYKYTFSDGKVYIGQTRRHHEKRRREHLDASIGPANSGFWEAYKKYGEPIYEILYEVDIDDVDELVNVLNIMETYYIQYYRADDIRYGYNKKSYGTVGTKTNTIIDRKYNEIYNELLDKRMQTYNSAIEKIWNTKIPLTDEEKYLIKEKYRENNHWQSYIDIYDLDNLSISIENKEDVFWFEEALDYVHFMITEEVRVETSQIIKENYTRFLDEERDKAAILQLDKEGGVVREFYSFNEICQVFNVPRADNIRNVLKGKQKSAYGYYWKYKKDM